MTSSTTTRRTSQYALSVPAPQHADADVHAALDALIASAVALRVSLTGSWVSSTNGYLCVSWRSPSVEAADTLALGILAAYDPTIDPATCTVHTGYGINRTVHYL